MISGIYSITNRLNGKRYIGSTVNFKRRLYEHLRLLRKNKHHCKHLQNAFNLHGEDAFVIEKVLVCSKSNLCMYEQVVMDFYARTSGVYNTQPESYTPRNSILTDEHKKNISKGLKGKPKSQAHKEALSKAMTGKKGHRTPKTEEHKARIKESVRAYWANLSDEERAARVTSAQAGRTRAKELVERMRTQSIPAGYVKE